MEQILVTIDDTQKAYVKESLSRAVTTQHPYRKLLVNKA